MNTLYICPKYKTCEVTNCHHSRKHLLDNDPFIGCHRTNQQCPECVKWEDIEKIDNPQKLYQGDL